MRATLSGICLALWVLPASAQSYLAVNRLDVVPMTQDTFEVIESRGAGASAIWCAAADYTIWAGRDGPRKRLYVLTPRGPSRTRAGATAVAYTLTPDDRLRNTPPSYSVSVRREGENLAVFHAHNFCDVFIDELLDRF